jgi:hypothetical protein
MNTRISTSILAATALLAASATAQAPWTTLPSPNPSPSSNQLYAVDGTGPNDVWAVGTYVDPASGFQSLALHWDGAQWTHVPTPTPNAGYWLKAVAAIAPNDVWAVGGHGLPYVFHFDGAAWSYALLPQPGQFGFGIAVADLVALAPDNIWAVGWYDITGTAHLRTAVWRWNGSSWSVVPSPSVPNTSGSFYPSVLHSISAANPDAIFAVGEWRIGNTWFPLALRYDGTSWQLQQTPVSSTGDGRLRAVSAAAPNDVWAVGTSNDDATILGGGYAQSFALHYDGNAWSVVPTPQPSSFGANPLRAVFAAEGKVYALGCWENATQGLDTFALYLDPSTGTGFTTIPSTNIPGNGEGWNELFDIARIGSQLWSVGYGSPQFPGFSQYLTLVERTAFAGDATVFCSGDGSAAACPCGNTGAPAHGCAWSGNPAGALLDASGSASISVDSLVLHGSAMPDSSALYFQGTTAVNGGPGAVFGDGLRCAGGTIMRLATRTNSAGASSYPVAGDQPISVRGQITSAGTRTYQVWYRNAAAFCTPSAFNLTNGLSVEWRM